MAFAFEYSFCPISPRLCYVVSGELGDLSGGWIVRVMQRKNVGSHKSLLHRGVTLVIHSRAITTDADDSCMVWVRCVINFGEPCRSIFNYHRGLPTSTSYSPKIRRNNWIIGRNWKRQTLHI